MLVRMGKKVDHRGRKGECDTIYQKARGISLCLSFIFLRTRLSRGIPVGYRGVVISARAAAGVPFSFVFYRDSCTPPGPDGLGIPRGIPDNEKKKETEQKLKDGERPDFSLVTRTLVAGTMQQNKEERRRSARAKERDR